MFFFVFCFFVDFFAASGGMTLFLGNLLESTVFPAF